MRILHVNKFLYRRGGAENYMLDLATLQRDEGHEIGFFAMQHEENESSTFDHLFPSRVDFEPIPRSLGAKLRGAGRMLWSLSAERGIRAVLDAFEPDLVHLHNIYHQLSPSILQPIRRTGTPAVMTLHDYKLACPTYRFLDHGQICEACVPHRFWNPTLKRCNGGSLAASTLNAVELTLHTVSDAYGAVARFVCPSRFMERSMRRSRVYPDRLRWVPNFVPVDTIVPKDAPGGGVVYAGRLSSEKGVDVLIESAVLHPRLEVVIAGDGPARADLEHRVEARGVGDRVRFLGRVGPDRLHTVLRTSSVLVVPSRWFENMPLSVLEGFACGLPVVASALGGLPELIEPGVDGYVVPPDDPQVLGDVLDGLLTSPIEAFDMGRAGRHKVETAFGPARHIERLDAVYAEAKARASTARA